jgi:hypothetical protein
MMFLFPEITDNSSFLECFKCMFCFIYLLLIVYLITRAMIGGSVWREDMGWRVRV